MDRGSNQFFAIVSEWGRLFRVCVEGVDSLLMAKKRIRGANTALPRRDKKEKTALESCGVVN